MYIPSPTVKRLAALVAALSMTAALAGCSRFGVKAYERGLLAKDSMLLVTDPIEAGLDDHIYFSKEASSGGRGFAGGGCGCN